MGAFKIVCSEKSLIDHIKQGGSVDDEVGMQLVAQVIDTAIQDKNVKQIAERFDFDAGDFAYIYFVMVNSLMPNPCISTAAGTKYIMLVATLTFVETPRLESMLAMMSEEAKGLEGQDRDDVMAKWATMTARSIWDVHTQERGEAPFEIGPFGTARESAAGCMGMLVAILTLSVLLISILL